MKVNRENFSDEINPKIFDKFVEVLKQHLQDGNTINLRNLGTLTTVRKPATKKMVVGKLLSIPESNSIKFTQSKNYTQQLEDNTADEKTTETGMEALLKHVKT